MRSRVDLPQPDGPTSTMNSPSPISSDTSSTAVTSALKRLVTPSSVIPATSPPRLPRPSAYRRDSTCGKGRPRDSGEPRTLREQEAALDAAVARARETVDRRGDGGRARAGRWSPRARAAEASQTSVSTPSSGVRRIGPIAREKPGSASRMPGESLQPGCIACTTIAASPQAVRPLLAERHLRALRARVGRRPRERALPRLQIVDGEPLGVHASGGHEEHARGRGRAQPLEQELASGGTARARSSRRSARCRRRSHGARAAAHRRCGSARASGRRARGRASRARARMRARRCRRPRRARRSHPSPARCAPSPRRPARRRARPAGCARRGVRARAPSSGRGRSSRP